MSSLISIVLLTTLLVISLFGCQNPQSFPKNKEIKSICGRLTTSELTLSDHERPLGIEYGYDRPFISAIQSDQPHSQLELPIEYGLQGGHHIDLSLRFVGELNPDLINLYITLTVDAPLTERFSGSHDTQAWYLLFPQNDEPEGCYFHRARIFLFDDSGAPAQASDVSELHGSLVSLDITLTAEDVTHHWHTRGRLQDQTDHF